MKKYLVLIIAIASQFSLVFAQSAMLSSGQSSSCVTIPVKIEYRSKDGQVSKYVTALQNFLYENNYLSTQPTGFFGAGTVKAVKAFQKVNNISQTGSLGPNTRAKIKAISCGNNSGLPQPNVQSITSSRSAYDSNKSELGEVALLADDILVTEGVTIPAPNGEVIFVWKSQTGSSNCVLAGKSVSSVGGPEVFKGMKSGQRYSFSCDSQNKSNVLNFTVGSVSSVASHQISKSEVVDVFLVAGQSNAVGQSISSQVNIAISDKVARYFSNNIQGVNKLGAWYSFGKTYTTKTGHAVIFVPASYPGTGATITSDNGNGNWGQSGVLFNSSILKLNSAMEAISSEGYSPNFKGVLWVQGENDADAINNSNKNGNNTYSKAQYKSALLSIISRYRSLYGNSMPFFIFQTGIAVDEPLAGYNDVQSVQREIDAEDANTQVVFDEASSFPLRGLMWDKYHYLPAGYKEMGVKGAEAIIASGLLSQVVNVSSPEVSLTDGSGRAVSNSSIKIGDRLNVQVSDLAKVGATKYYLNMGYQNPSTGAVSWYLKGPFVKSLTDTVAGFGFDIGTYYMQIKGCNDSDLCSNFESTPSVTPKINAIKITVTP